MDQPLGHYTWRRRRRCWAHPTHGGGGMHTPLLFFKGTCKLLLGDASTRFPSPQLESTQFSKRKTCPMGMVGQGEFRCSKNGCGNQAMEAKYTSIEMHPFPSSHSEVQFLFFTALYLHGESGREAITPQGHEERPEKRCSHLVAGTEVKLHAETPPFRVHLFPKWWPNF